MACAATMPVSCAARAPSTTFAESNTVSSRSTCPTYSSTARSFAASCSSATRARSAGIFRSASAIAASIWTRRRPRIRELLVQELGVGARLEPAADQGEWVAWLADIDARAV